MIQEQWHAAEPIAVDGVPQLPHDYPDLRKRAKLMGTSKLMVLLGNVKLTLAHNKAHAVKIPISDLDLAIFSVAAQLKPEVLHYEHAKECVFEMDSARAVASFPQRYNEALTVYCRHGMRIFFWDSEIDKFMVYSLEEFFRRGVYLRASLAIIGPAGVGKSITMGHICQRICRMRNSDRFIITKAIDPLGVLTETNELSSAGCLALTDFELTAGRGVTMSTKA